MVARVTDSDNQRKTGPQLYMEVRKGMSEYRRSFRVSHSTTLLCGLSQWKTITKSSRTANGLVPTRIKVWVITLSEEPQPAECLMKTKGIWNG